MVPSYIGLGPLTVIKALSSSHDSRSRITTCHNSPQQAQHRSSFSLKIISRIYTYESETNTKHKLNMNTMMNIRNSKKHFSLTLPRYFTELQSKHKGFKNESRTLPPPQRLHLQCNLPLRHISKQGIKISYIVGIKPKSTS